MRSIWIFLFVLAFFSACQPSKKARSAGTDYPNNIGDILPDSALDDPSFHACRESNIPQYYSIQSGYAGEKPAILRYFRENFRKEKSFGSENGFITIRFVVNCNGQTGRFRVLEMGQDYKPKTFSEPLRNRLLQLTKQMPGWLPGKSENIPYDYYQYLTFTIVQGDIAQITP